jgi:C-terminal processing protease CtpA/Prc
MPPGTESANPRNRNANTDAASSETPVREVLGMFGVEGNFVNGGWKVQSVKEHSLGARVKIAAGDVIESIDGQQIKNETKLKAGVKTFTVRRDGKVIILSGN